MTEFIIEYGIELAFTAIISLLSLSLRLMYKKIKRLVLVEKAMQALLKDRIIQAYNHNIERGYCPIYALESITEMYAQYHQLGGNGAITKLVDELKKLPTQKF